MLECKRVSYSYDGERNVLEEITLSFVPGEFCGIFGPNGSGKSTLLKLLTGELKCTAGTVSPVWKDPLERARNIALVEQQIPASLPLNVEEIAALGNFPWEKRRRSDMTGVCRVLEELELLPLRQRRFDTLSGGERQRVMLARALVQDTPVICLDEPGSSLDIGFQHTLCRTLKKLAGQGRTVIMVSHDLFSAPRYLDRMLLLGDGRLVMQGKPEELAGGEVFNTLFNLPDPFRQ